MSTNGLPFGRVRARRVLAWTCAAVFLAPGARAEPPVARILEQDPARNNLVDPPGYRPAELGTLADVRRAGDGAQAMLLVPGLGFGGEIFDELTARLGGEFRTWAVTLPGFGGSAAPPAPPETTSFGAQTWTNGALAALEKLLADEAIERPIVVGHWLTGTQLALRLAMAHPDRVRGVVLLAGAARLTATDPQRAAFFATPEKRVAATDQFLAPRWFKTVTRETWDDNNFYPDDYAVDRVRGLRLWRAAARPDLHVWVRYLCEFNAQDVCAEIDRLATPTLLLEPGLEGLPRDPANDYMKAYLHDSWQGCAERNPRITVKTIPDARVGIWFDQPDAVTAAIRDFVASLP